MPNEEIGVEDWEVKFDKEFIHRGEDSDDPPENWAWTLKGSFPIEVKFFIRSLLSSRDESWSKRTTGYLDEVVGAVVDASIGPKEGESMDTAERVNNAARSAADRIKKELEHKL
jgi:hypothetical protein